MGMLKGNSSSLNFDQLMAQATQVAKQQDAALMERARQKLREEEDRRKREARAAREKEAAEYERRLQQQQQQKKKTSMGQTKRQTSSKMSDPTERKKNLSTATTTTKGRNVNSSKRFPSASQPASSFLPEKKKPVDMTFEDLMRTAKEQSLNKTSSVEKPTPNKSRSVEKPRESLYYKQPQRKLTSTPPSNDHQLSARERAKLMGADVPKRVMNNTKKDRRSISEIQREIRHSKGINSDEEEGSHSSRKDSRLMSGKNKQPQRYQYNTSPLPRKKQLSPPPRQSQAPMKRSSIPPPASRAAPPAGPRRMPFSGRPLDGGGRRGGSSQQQMHRRQYREEEEDDDEMDDFVVDDEEDEGYDGHSRNGYSDEISKIFRYNKNRYANEPIYSDDDMEANASDVLREEKRSERIARREDLIEEQKELERLQKRKKRP